MRLLVIEAINNVIDAKRDLVNGLSTKQIRTLIDAFMLDFECSSDGDDRLDELEHENLKWEVKQYFMKKYGI